MNMIQGKRALTSVVNMVLLSQHYINDDVKDTTYQDFKYFIRWTLNNKGKIKNINTEYEKKLTWIKENITKIDNYRNEIGLIPYAYQAKMRLNQIKFFLRTDIRH